MIRYILYQNQNKFNEASFEKWYPRIVADETYDLHQLATHMSKHNTPYSEGVIKGVMTDMIACIKELLLDGKCVKLDDLAIFTVGIRSNGGAASEKEFSVSENVRGVKLRARATGKLSTAKLNLDAILKRSTTASGSTTGGSGNESGKPDSGGSGSGGGGGEDGDLEGI